MDKSNENGEPSRGASDPQPADLAAGHSAAARWRFPAPWDGAADDGGITLAAMIHALRRRWLAGVLAGVPIAALVAGLLWWTIPVRYEATAELLVKSQEDRLLPVADPRTRGDYAASDFDIFRQTQASLLTSTFVLTDVLRQPSVARLPMLAKEENPIGFLQNNIKTSYPNDSEVLRVSLRGEDPAQIITIVDAVTDSYLEEIVAARRQRLMERVDRLRKQHAAGEEDIRRRREQIHAAKTQVGAQDTAQARVRHQLELERLRKLDDERGTLARRVHELDLKIVLQQTVADDFQEVEVPEYLVQEQLERDPQYQRLRQEFDLAQQQYAANAAAARASAPSVQRAASRVELLHGQLNARRRQLQSRISQKLRAELAGSNDSEIGAAMLQAEHRILMGRLDEITRAHEEQFDFVRQLDDFSAKLQSDQEELDHRVAVNRSRQQEIYDLSVQLDSPERIQKIQKASIPASNSSATKLLQVALAALVSLGLAVGGLALWDLLGGRVSASRDVSQTIAAPVFGTLPLLQRGPLRWMSRATLDAAMAEGVDSIRTALLRHSKLPSGASVMLITSATGGEGKSTLAGHLAISFGRAGRKTLLIDGDTRNPQQHEMFGLRSAGGLCDALRTGEDLQPFVQSTPFEGVDALPAGQCDPRSHKALANGAARMLLKEVGNSYDVVLIDAGPVLTNADALLLAQWADLVVLSAIRDLSRLPKIADAQDRLRAVGVEVAGVVVHGVPAELRRSGMHRSPAPQTNERNLEAELSSA